MFIDQSLHAIEPQLNHLHRKLTARLSVFLLKKLATRFVRRQKWGPRSYALKENEQNCEETRDNRFSQLSGLQCQQYLT